MSKKSSLNEQTLTPIEKDFMSYLPDIERGVGAYQKAVNIAKMIAKKNPERDVKEVLREMLWGALAFFIVESYKGNEAAIKTLMRIIETGVDAVNDVTKKHPDIGRRIAMSRLNWPILISPMQSKEELFKQLTFLKEYLGLGFASPLKITSKTRTDALFLLTTETIGSILFNQDGLMREKIPSFTYANWPIWKKLLSDKLDQKFKPLDKDKEKWTLYLKADEKAFPDYQNYKYIGLKKYVETNLKAHKWPKSAWTNIKNEILQRCFHLLPDKP